MKRYIITAAEEGYEDFKKHAYEDLKSSKLYDTLSSISNNIVLGDFSDMYPRKYERLLVLAKTTNIARLRSLTADIAIEDLNNEACIEALKSVIDSCEYVDSRIEEFSISIEYVSSCCDVSLKCSLGIFSVFDYYESDFVKLMKRESSRFCNSRMKKSDKKDTTDIKKFMHSAAKSWCDEFLSNFVSEYGISEVKIKNVRLDPDYEIDENSDEAYVLVDVYGDGQNIGTYQLTFFKQDGKWFCRDTEYDTSDEIREFLSESLE